MITRNLVSYFMNRVMSRDISVKARSGSTITIASSTSYWMTIHELSTSFTGVVNSRYTRTIRIGSGTTDPTYDDYELESMIAVAPKNIMATRSGSYKNTYEIVTATFLNETDSDWNVTEVGQYISTSSSDVTAAILLAREVFDPVTVKPGQTFSVSMKLF